MQRQAQLRRLDQRPRLPLLVPGFTGRRQGFDDEVVGGFIFLFVDEPVDVLPTGHALLPYRHLFLRDARSGENQEEGSQRGARKQPMSDSLHQCGLHMLESTTSPSGSSPRKENSCAAP